MGHPAMSDLRHIWTEKVAECTRAFRAEEVRADTTHDHAERLARAYWTTAVHAMRRGADLCACGNGGCWLNRDFDDRCAELEGTTLSFAAFLQEVTEFSGLAVNCAAAANI